MADGTLFVVATPIGNLEDVTLRALRVLREVSVIAAEDTRHTRKLLSAHGISARLVSFHANSPPECARELVARLRAGESIALVTDAGTPGVSDPGFLLVRAALDAGIAVTVIPGPSAAVAALAASGLPTNGFAFLGFPPSRGAARRRFFEAAAGLPMTLVLYESPRRLPKSLADAVAVLGDRPAAVCRELTKLHEEVFRGSLAEAAARFAEAPRGEVTLVVGGATPRETPPKEGGEEDWRGALAGLLRAGATVKDAASEVAARFGIPRREAYQEALRAAKPGDDERTPKGGARAKKSPPR